MANFVGSLERLGITILDMLKDDVKINFILSRNLPIDLRTVNSKVQEIIYHPNKNPGNVALFLDLLWDVATIPSANVPESKIKIAYSM